MIFFLAQTSEDLITAAAKHSTSVMAIMSQYNGTNRYLVFLKLQFERFLKKHISTKMSEFFYEPCLGKCGWIKQWSVHWTYSRCAHLGLHELPKYLQYLLSFSLLLCPIPVWKRRPKTGRCLWLKNNGKSQNGPKTKLTRVLLANYTLGMEIGMFCPYPLITRGIKV